MDIERVAKHIDLIMNDLRQIRTISDNEQIKDHADNAIRALDSLTGELDSLTGELGV